MKYKMLKHLATVRQWANTENGEQAITKCLSLLLGILVIDTILFSIGLILQ